MEGGIPVKLEKVRLWVINPERTPEELKECARGFNLSDRSGDDQPRRRILQRIASQPDLGVESPWSPGNAPAAAPQAAPDAAPAAPVVNPPAPERRTSQVSLLGAAALLFALLVGIAAIVFAVNSGDDGSVNPTREEGPIAPEESPPPFDPEEPDVPLENESDKEVGVSVTNDTSLFECYDHAGGIPSPPADVWTADVAPDEIEVFTGGPMTVNGVHLPGGTTRGSVVLYLPVDHVIPIRADGVVPGANWHCSTRPIDTPNDENTWRSIADHWVVEMGKAPNCTPGRGCSVIDVLVVRGNQVVDQWVVR